MGLQDNSLYNGISRKKEMRAYIGTLLQNNQTLAAENAKLRQAVNKYTEAVKCLQDENKEMTEKYTALELETSHLKNAEMEKLEEFSEVISEGKKMMNQILVRSEQEARQIEFAAKQVLDEAQLQAQHMRNQSALEMEGVLETFRNVGHLAKQSKEELTALCDAAEEKVLRYVTQMEAAAKMQSAEKSNRAGLHLTAVERALSNE